MEEENRIGNVIKHQKTDTNETSFARMEKWK
jgi:hypothetical protein